MNCIKICKLKGGVCIGCHRTIEEIKTKYKEVTMNKGEQGYLNMLSNIINFGEYRQPVDTNGEPTEEGRYELFAQTLKFDLSGGVLPLMTTKKVFFKSLAYELLWFLTGSQDINFLKKHNVKIWDIWANEENVVGPLYGFQWRHWQVDEGAVKYNGYEAEIDQMAQVMKSLRDKPEARSHVITNWRPDMLNMMAIKPCHGIHIQFYRINDEISMLMTQRSCDAYLGVPFNIAQYSLLLHMVAHQLGCRAKEFTWVGADVHIYENHLDQVHQQLAQPVRDFPTLTFARMPESIFDYQFDDFSVWGYVQSDYVPAEVSPQGQPGKGVLLK